MFRVIFFLLLVVTPCFANPFKLFEENGKVGMKNEQGQVVLPPSFEALGWSDGSFSVIGQITGYKLKGRWGLLNLKKEFITKAEFESLTCNGADRVVARKSISPIAAKMGSLNLEGEVTIPFIYDDLKIHGLRAVVMEKRGPHYLFGLTDLENKVILPLHFKNLYPVGSLRYAAENADGKLALFTDTGNAVTDFSIDSIGQFHRDFAIVFSNGLQGLINRDGEMKVKPQYSKIEQRESVRALQPSLWKIITPENQELQSMVADAAHPYSDNRFRIERATKQGLVDGDLRIVWPLVYDVIGPMINGHAAAKKEGRWGLLSNDAKEIVPFDFDSLLWDGKSALTANSSTGKILWKFLNVERNSKSARGYDHLERMDEEYYSIARLGFFGLMNNNGQEMLHCVYDSILEIRGNQVAVKFKNQYGIVSTTENWLLAPQQNRIWLANAERYLEQHTNNVFLKSFTGDIVYFSANPMQVFPDFLLERLPENKIKKIGWDGVEIKTLPGVRVRSIDENSGQLVASPVVDGLQLFENQGKFGFTDTRGRLIIPNRYDSAKHFSEGLAAFKLLGKWGYLNVADKIVVNPTFESAGNFQNGHARVMAKGKFGLIDREGKLQLALQYDSIIQQNKHLLVYQNGMAGLATQQGRIVIQPRYEKLELLPNNQALVKLNGSFGVVSQDGLGIIPIVYDSLEYDAAKNVFLAHQPSKWLTLMGF